jgi:phage terminase large subunit-like protein
VDVIDLTKKGANVFQAYQQQRDKGCYVNILEKYRDPATVYSWMVLEERVVAGYMIQLDSFRHLQDLRRIDEDTNFRYTYELTKCRNILNFSKLCPDVDTGQPLPLMLWQQAILCKCQGWRDENGEKRFKRVNLSVARTNGKTYLDNILLTYAFLVECDGAYNQDLGYIAPVTSQSKKGWRYLATTFNYLKEMPAFRDIFKREQISVINDEARSGLTQNKMMRLSHESGKLDSFHFKTIVSDEAGDNQSIAKIKDNSGKITSGQVQTFDSQFIQISTAYPDSNSGFYADERMLQEAMEKDYDRTLDDNLCMVWEQDELSETEQPETWVKSNPILNLKQKHDSMLQSMISERDTKLENGTLAEFQNKNLNMWLQVKENTYLELDDINDAVVSELPITFKGREVYIGFDKSNFSDDTALSFIFPYTQQGKNMFFVYQHSWVPLARAQNNINIKEKQDGINYRHAAELGFADIADNKFGYINDDAIFDWLMNFVIDNELKVNFFAYDTWSTEEIILRLEQKTDWNLIPIRQGTRSLNRPTVEFRKQLSMQNISYLKDPVILYSLKNAILLVDNNGIKVDKDKATSKIDFVDATIDAFSQAMFHFSEVNPNFNPKDNTPFANMTNDQINDHFKNDFSF